MSHPYHRARLIHRIENIICELAESARRGEKPTLSYDDGKNSGWINSCSMLPDSEPLALGSHTKTIVFSGHRKRQRFALIMRVMAHVYRNLTAHLGNHVDNEFYCNKREFYYSLKNEKIKRFVRGQGNVEWAIDQVTMLLECGPWDLGKEIIEGVIFFEKFNALECMPYYRELFKENEMIHGVLNILLRPCCLI